MKPYLPIAGVLVIGLGLGYWWGSAKGGGSVTDPKLVAENDSLKEVVVRREAYDSIRERVFRSMLTTIDSLKNNAPATEIRYRNNYASLAHWSNDSIWRYLGQLPDTARIRTP